MIKTARQLKDLIRNLSKDKSADAQILMRNYMMERFLERISLSGYRDKFILKGGMLVAAMVGLDARSTMDIDATVKGAAVGIEEVENMIASIISVPVDDSIPILSEIVSAGFSLWKPAGKEWNEERSRMAQHARYRHRERRTEPKYPKGKPPYPGNPGADWKAQRVDCRPVQSAGNRPRTAAAISQPCKSVDEVFERPERKEPEVFAELATAARNR